VGASDLVERSKSRCAPLRTCPRQGGTLAAAPKSTPLRRCMMTPRRVAELHQRGPTARPIHSGRPRPRRRQWRDRPPRGGALCLVCAYVRPRFGSALAVGLSMGLLGSFVGVAVASIPTFVRRVLRLLCQDDGSTTGHQLPDQEVPEDRDPHPLERGRTKGRHRGTGSGWLAGAQGRHRGSGTGRLAGTKGCHRGSGPAGSPGPKGLPLGQPGPKAPPGLGSKISQVEHGAFGTGDVALWPVRSCVVRAR